MSEKDWKHKDWIDLPEFGGMLLELAVTVEEVLDKDPA